MSEKNGLQHLILTSFQGRAPVHENLARADFEAGLFVCVDGIGGASGGIGAAKLALESVFDFMKKKSYDAEATLPFFRDPKLSHDLNLLKNAIYYAHQRVCDWNHTRTAISKGGASMMIGKASSSRLALVGVGQFFVYQGTAMGNASGRVLLEPEEHSFLGQSDGVPEINQLEVSVSKGDQWLVSNQSLADDLDQIGNLTPEKGINVFRARALRSAFNQTVAMIYF